MESPVAGAVAYREEDGLVLSAGLFKGFLAPGIPVHLRRSHQELKVPLLWGRSPTRQTVRILEELLLHVR